MKTKLLKKFRSRYGWEHVDGGMLVYDTKTKERTFYNSMREFTYIGCRELISISRTCKYMRDRAERYDRIIYRMLAKEAGMIFIS